MKKIFILSFLIVFTLVANAASQLDTKEKVIDRAKAIAARHVIHNKGAEFKNTGKNEHVNAKDVDALEKLIKSDPDKKYKKICDEIEDYPVDDKDIASLIKSFEGLLSKYGVKDPGALQQVKTPITNSSKLFGQKEEKVTPSDDKKNEDNDDKKESDDDEGVASSSVASSSSVEGNTSGTFRRSEVEGTVSSDLERREKAEGFSLLLPLVLLIIALAASLFMCFRLWRKNNDLEAIRRETIDELSIMVNSNTQKKSLKEIAKASRINYNTLKKENEKLNKEINGLKSQLVQMEKDNRRINNYYTSFHNSTEHHNVRTNDIGEETSTSTTLTWKIQNERKDSQYHEPDVVSERVSLVDKEMYLYLPNDGIFKEGSEEYRPGKTLYKMTYTSDEAADFEFVKKTEALAFAKQSRSRFLEGACIIENDDAESFNTIVTLEKGKLVKNNEGWEIISKARIRLS